MKKVAIFDFDGTIANSFPWFISRINHVARILRFNKVKDEDIERLRSMSTEEILKDLGISFIKLPFVIFYMKRLMSKELHLIELFPEVPLLFATLNTQGIEIVILSSNSSQNVKSILGDTAELVSAFFCGAGLRTKERHFRLVKKAFPKSDLLSIGDEPRDAIAAAKVGISHLNVSWGYASVEVFNDPSLVESFSDLEKRIFGHFNMKS